MSTRLFERRRRPRSSASPRGWVTLVALVIAVLTLSLGPGRLIELIAGLVFVQPRATSNAVPATHLDAQLQAALADVASSLSHGRLATAAIDLKTGASASVDADRPYPAASLFKLPILLSVLADEDAGRLDPEQQVEIRPEDWADGSGVLQARIGDHLSVRELSRLMIKDSDNIAALALLDLTGIAHVTATADRLGLRATRVVDHRGGEPGDHTTSAADMAQLLMRVATAQAINERVSQQALDLLEVRQSVSWLGGELPFWVKVAHKWGDLPEARNDAGVVFTPRGTYVVAVLVENGEPDESAAAIARVSRRVYDYLGSR